MLAGLTDGEGYTLALELLVDDELILGVTPNSLHATLARIEERLLEQERLIEKIMVGDRVFWSLENVLQRTNLEAESIQVQSTPVLEYVANVCQTAIEYTTEINDALDRCAFLWENGNLHEVSGLWAQALEGLDWLIESGTQVARLVQFAGWETAVSKLTHSLEKIEVEIASGNGGEVSRLLRDDLSLIVSSLGKWFEETRAQVI